MLIKANQWVTITFQAKWPTDVEVNNELDLINVVIQLRPNIDGVILVPEQDSKSTMTGLGKPEEM